ncbi:MAG: hypothetical protein H6822_20210 [Planctomycetaceae bacterium]|nr:hypothetical protein [Planctomycetales bacterium]MCB9924513.1 hypothetical protein [Planctomycetaceae bacterium]
MQSKDVSPKNSLGVSRLEATRQLVDSFSRVPSQWIEELGQARGEYLPLPMWGTLFMPSDSSDVRQIERLLRPIDASGEDEQCLSDAGWQEVADTGIYAIDFDDELLLGIHGAGYNFYDHHWSKLYTALGYRWHTD